MAWLLMDGSVLASSRFSMALSVNGALFACCFRVLPEKQSGAGAVWLACFVCLQGKSNPKAGAL